MAYRSDSERQALIDKVQELAKQGLILKDACDKVGLPFTTYYGWLRKQRGSKPKAKIEKQRRAHLISIPLPDDKLPLVVLIGNSADIAASLERIASIHRSAR